MWRFLAVLGSHLEAIFPNFLCVSHWYVLASSKFLICWPASMKLNPDADFVVLCAELGGIPDLNCISHQPNCTQVYVILFLWIYKVGSGISFGAMSEHRQ